MVLAVVNHGEPAEPEAPRARPLPAVSSPPSPRKDSPFIVVKAEGLEDASFRLTPRRAMLRKAESGFPMSSLDLAMEVTATGDRAIDKLEVIVVLEAFQQQTQLVWEVFGDLKPPLEPGETRVVTRNWHDVPNRIDRLRLRNPKVQPATVELPRPAVVSWVPKVPESVSVERLTRAVAFETRRAGPMPEGHKWAGRFVADIQVRVLEPEAIAYLQLKPVCVAADGKARDHNIADYGMQLYIAGRFPDEAAWSRADDVRVYRALCYEDTVDVRWRLTEFRGGPSW
jgi:hypothetical protein